MMRTRTWLLSLPLQLCLGMLPARAHDLPPDVAGSRSLAMGGAHRGLGNSNDALYLNPAGIALNKRYGVEMQYLYTGGANQNLLNSSAVDSKSGPVAGGLGYSRIWGNPSGTDAQLNRMHAATAVAFSQFLAIGLGGDYLRGKLRNPGAAHHRELNAINASLGLSLRLGQLLGLGLTYDNLLSKKEQDLQPQVMAVGSSLNLGIVTLAADLSRLMRAHAQHPWAIQVGAEALIGSSLAVRAGYQDTPSDRARMGPGRSSLSGGLGIVSPSSAINLSYEQRLGTGSLWRVMGGVVFYL